MPTFWGDGEQQKNQQAASTNPTILWNCETEAAPPAVVYLLT